MCDYVNEKNVNNIFLIYLRCIQRSHYYTYRLLYISLSNKSMYEYFVTKISFGNNLIIKYIFPY